MAVRGYCKFCNPKFCPKHNPKGFARNKIIKSPMSLNLNKDLKQEFEQHCAENDLKKSPLIERLVDEYMQKIKKNELKKIKKNENKS